MPGNESPFFEEAMTFGNILIMALAASAVALPADARAQQADSGAFFVRLGKDTLSVERYVRNSRQLIADAVMRTPQTRMLKLTVTFRDDGNVSWYELWNNPVPGVPKAIPVVRNLVTYVGDSARVERWVGGVQLPTRTVAAKATMIPLQSPFYSTYELALAKAVKHDTSTIAMLTAGGVLPYHVSWLNGDTVTLSNPQVGTLTARFDKEGHLQQMNGAGTTFKVIVERARWLDLAPYTRKYVVVDSAGKSLGMLSPRDTAMIDDTITNIIVDYGRPSKRGRAIFGGIVPWGQVWRTGANAATQIEFIDPVEINGAKVPAGKYTLWSVPDPQQWQIILNKQTGQWGTAYDEKQDLIRIPVKSAPLAKPVEKFTIDIRPTVAGAVMTLMWDRTRVVVPIVKQR